ncbi:MAG: DUF3086 domain-containing protein [Cyanophyceae cyanobacterium]
MNSEYPNGDISNGGNADAKPIDPWDQSDAPQNHEPSSPLPAVQSVVDAELPLPPAPDNGTEATQNAAPNKAPDEIPKTPTETPIAPPSHGQENDQSIGTPQGIAPPQAEPELTPEPTPRSTPEPTPKPTQEPLPKSVEELMALDIQRLQQERDSLQRDVYAAQDAMVRTIQAGTAELEERRSRLRASIDKLEMRRERLREEMRTTFAGSSQRVAARVQGFKDFLLSSLQDLSAAAEDLELVKPAPPQQPAQAPPSRESQGPVNPQFARGRFEEEMQRIRKILERYQMRPDYYGPPWRLRRTFENIHRERVANWFGEQGGRGAIQSLGSRLQNILVVSATISVTRALYGDRLHVLVLIDSPERLGEWRRGLQDCLGISRGDFGPDRGVTLFDSAEALAQTADRTRRAGDLPFIIIDESEGKVSLSLLQFPLWLAIAPDPRAQVYDYF